MTAEGMTPAKATALRQPFPEESVGKLPKGGQMLDYVGHAAVTDRLLTVDPDWSWEPLAVGPDGLPAYDRAGNLWIRLTVCGVTRIGVGDGKSAKECIGDALRNAAMRFGVALDLWAKENLVEFAQAARAAQRPAAPAPAPPAETGEVITEEQVARLGRALSAHGLTKRAEALLFVGDIIGRPVESRDELTAAEAERVIDALTTRAPAPTNADPAEGGGEAPEAGPVTLPPSRAMTKPQSRMLFARLNELGVDNADREERLAICSALVGRDLTSSSELNRDDAQKLLDDLGPIRDRAGLNAYLDELDNRTESPT